MAIGTALIRRRPFYVINDDDKEWFFFGLELKTQRPYRFEEVGAALALFHGGTFQYV